MRKNIFIGVCCFFMVQNLFAQDNEVFYRFMKKYVHNWSVGYYERTENDSVKLVEQIGKVKPDYFFDKKLNSKALKGKYVILNFWATWCEGCRILSCDIDSMIREEPSVYDGVQVIGVDAHEGLVDKGFKARKWWEANISTYPAVYGEKADECCDLLKGEHPSVFLLNDQGIVCGRWDAWSPGVAEYITTAIWALKVMPERGIEANMDNVRYYMDRKEYMKALYLLEMMPDKPENSACRYVCMLGVGAFDHATACFRSLQEKYERSKSTENDWNWKPSREYVEIMKTIGSTVYDSGTESLEILKNGIDALKICIDADASDVVCLEQMGMLRIRYADAYKLTGIEMLRQALRKIDNGGNDIGVKERIEKSLEMYEE